MQRSCAQCSSAYSVEQSHLAFYDEVSPIIGGTKQSVPPPRLCPDCRMQRRMTWRNERLIYRSTCSLCKRSIISQYAPESPYRAYCHQCFWGDGWDPLSYARAIGFDRPFREQFDGLIRSVPLLALINTQAENSEYCHRIYDGRNNYLSFIVLFGPENLHYTYYTVTCKDCIDVSITQYSELCYELADAAHCYQCSFGTRIRNCRNSLFLEDCIGCSDCFGCKNLHQKQYCIFNEQKTRGEYEEFLRWFDSGSHSQIEMMHARVRAFFLTLPNHPIVTVNAENVSGSYIYNSRNVTDSFDVHESEHLYRCWQVERCHNCQDCYGMGRPAFCYDLTTAGHPSAERILFSAATLEGCADLLYCYDCYAGTQNCFGCVGLKKKQYCILNKQYSKEEYERLVQKLITHMRGTQEWGEFLPVTVSPFAYNETVAQESFPLTKEETEQRGWLWRDPKDEMPKVERLIPGSQLPDRIGEIPDDILNWAIACEVTRRPFRIIRQELEFYRKIRLPIPRLHPDERHSRRMAQRNPRKLWDRTCMKCAAGIKTSYAPERPETVYCEKCYLETVY